MNKEIKVSKIWQLEFCWGGEPLVCLYNKYLYIFLLKLRAVFYVFLKITNQISHNRFMYQIPKIKSFI